MIMEIMHTKVGGKIYCMLDKTRQDETNPGGGDEMAVDR